MKNKKVVVRCERCKREANGIFSVGGKYKVLCWDCERYLKSKEGKKSLKDVLEGR